MAVVTITLSDKADGTVGLNISSDPPLPTEGVEDAPALTIAQLFAARCVDAMEDCSEDADEDAGQA